ncbi:hypothetical protein KI387_014451, partial [Taxus chinensis]
CILPILHTQERYGWLTAIEAQFDEDDREILDSLVYVIGLAYVADMPQITLDNGLLIAIMERWHNEIQCFRLSTGEITITLKD